MWPIRSLFVKSYTNWDHFFLSKVALIQSGIIFYYFDLLGGEKSFSSADVTSMFTLIIEKDYDLLTYTNC